MGRAMMVAHVANRKGHAMRKPPFTCALTVAMALFAVTDGAACAEPDILQPENLKTMDCGKPDTRYMFVRSSRPGNVFYPGEAVDLRSRSRAATSHSSRSRWKSSKSR